VNRKTGFEQGELERLVRGHGKKFVRLKEGAALYSMGINSFRELAKDAGAIYHIKKIVLINTELIDEFLESFRDEEY